MAARATAASPAGAGFRPAGAALAVAAVFALQPGIAAAQPAGAQVIHGQATFQRNGNDLLVTTRNGAGTRHSAIDWQSFSVPAGSITQFNQPSADSLSINRVVGSDPSAIFGTLRSNGRLVLVNPAGIAVGAGAVVDTAGFTASTLRMSEADAVAGRLRFANDGSSGALVVQGTVRAQGGDVVLVAPDVQTAGPALVQSDGATVLVAGRKVEITGRGLEGIHLEVQAGDRAVNLGTLQGDAVGIFAGTLRHSGVVQAQALAVEGGKVVLKATGDNLVSGAIGARAADGRGGSIDVLGERVGLLAGAALDASGVHGGGQVRIGGDYQGGNAAVPNAAQTYVDASATISADATQDGHGGRVIVWADDTTRMHGHISARGGAQGGNGGFTEVSGKKYLEFTGLADLRAPKGAAGTLLLDPQDIEIVAEGTGNYAMMASGLSPFLYTSTGPEVGRVSQLDAGTLRAQLAFGDVEVTTEAPSGNGGQITVNADAVVNWSNAAHLTLRADQGIDVLGTIQGDHDASGLALHALAGSITISNGAQVSAGSVQLNADNAHVVVTDANLRAVAGSLTVDAGGRISVERSDVQGAAGTALVAAGDVTMGAQSGREVTITSGGLVRIVSHGGRVVLSEQAPESTRSPSPVRVTGQSVEVRASEDAFFGYDSTVDAQGGTLSVTSVNGSITGWGTFTTHGSADPQGLGGALSLQAENGSLSFHGVNTSGDDWDHVHAGNVTLSAQGDVDGSWISANGTIFAGEGAMVSAAGNGGTVKVTSTAGDIRLDSITANAASPSWWVSEGLAAGRAGSVTVQALAADIEVPGHVTIGSISARGGSGVAGTDGGTVRIEATGDIALWASEGASIDVAGGDAEVGDGGRGGQVFVTAGGSVSLASRPPLRTEGDDESQFRPGSAAVNAQGGTGGSDGRGGRGGDVDIHVGAQFSAGPIVASGGWGFDGNPDAVHGGAGGAGGTITVQQDRGDLFLGSDTLLDARGGEGGSAYWDAPGALGGQGGDGGTITLKVLRGDLLMGADIAAGAGDGGFHADSGQRAAHGGLGNVDLQAAGLLAIGNNGIDSHHSNITARAGGDLVLLDALWTDGGAVTLVAGDGTLAAADPLAPAAGELASVHIFSRIDTRGEDGSAGNVTLRAPGAVHIGFLPEPEPEPGEDQRGIAAALLAPGEADAPGLTAGAIDLAAQVVVLDEGTSVVGSQVRIAADQVGLAGTIDSGAGTTTLTTFTATRAIRLGGTETDDVLYVDQAGIDRITAGRLAIGGATAAGGLDVQGPITLDADKVATLDLRNAGAITQAAGSLLGAANLDVAGGSVLLADVSIAGTLGGSSSTGAFEVHNRSAGTLTLGAVTGGSVASPVLVTTEGRLRVAGNVSSAAQGNALTLAADTLELADGGAVAAPNGRWLVYLDQLQGNDFSNDATTLASGNHALWGRTFADNAPGTIAETGNRYVFAFRPTVDVVAGSASKVYDGTTAFAGLEAAATVTGLVDAAQFGNVFLQDQASGQFAIDGVTKNVGTYGISRGTYGVAGYAVNFTGATATITPRALNVTFGVQDKVYDGKVDATAVFGDDRIAGDDLAFTGSAAFADKNAGTGKNAVVRLDALGGADAGNYVVASGTQAAKGSIARRTLNLVSATAQDKVYDGTTTAVASVTDDRIAGDDLTVAATGRFADRNAGTGKAVSVQAQGLSGGDAGNYELAAESSVATRANITPASLVITARDRNKPQGSTLSLTGAPDEFTATGLVDGESVASVTLASAGAPAGAAAGNYAIVASDAVAGSGFVASNYDISYRDGVLAVLPVQAGPASNEVVNQVTTFAHLFLQEALRQEGERPFGRDAIVVTDTACTPQ